jgi:hypothetical protein
LKYKSKHERKSREWGRMGKQNKNIRDQNLKIPIYFKNKNKNKKIEWKIKKK